MTRTPSVLLAAALSLPGFACEASDEAAPAPSATPGASAASPESPQALHQRLLGTWRGEVVGESADRLKAARLFLQQEEPTEEQLAPLDEDLRAQVRAQRDKLAQASESEARLLQSMTSMMLQIFDDLRMEITSDAMKLRLGSGDSAKTEEVGYEVVQSRADELVLRTTDGKGSIEEATIVFDGANAFITKRSMGKNDFELRFTRTSE